MSALEQQAQAVILGYAEAHAAVGGVLATTVVGDVPLLGALSSLMIMRLGDICGQHLDASFATGLATTLFSQVGKTYLAFKCVSLVPLVGNVVNASISFDTAQVIGWAAFGILHQNLPHHEAVEYGQAKKVSHEQVQRLIRTMSGSDRAKYRSLQQRLRDVTCPEAERQAIIAEMTELFQRYQRPGQRTSASSARGVAPAP